MAKTVRAAASLQWKAEGAATWVLDDRSSKLPACFAPPPARDGENNLTFAKASVMFSLSPSLKFIFLMQLGESRRAANQPLRLSAWCTRAAHA